MRRLCTVMIVFLSWPFVASAQALTLDWEYPTPGLYPQGLLRDQPGRPYLYAALKNGGLAILNVAKPRVPPRQVAVLPTNRLGGLEVMHLTQQGEVLFLALGNFFDANGSPAGLAAVSVRDPQSPRVLSLWKSPGKLRGAAAVLVKENTAFLGAMDQGVFIFDVSDPANIRKTSEVLPEVHFPLKNPNRIQHPNARGLAIKGNLLFVAFDAGGLRVIDVAKPLKPREIARYINAGMGKKQQAYNNLVIDGTTAYIAIDYAGLEVVDIGNPRDLKQVGWWNPWKAQTLANLWFNSPGHTNQIELDARHKLVYLSAGGSGLQIVDVSNPARPAAHASFGEPKDKLGVWGLTMSDEQIYLAYITAVVPFRGTWAGIKAVRR